MGFVVTSRLRRSGGFSQLKTFLESERLDVYVGRIHT